MTSKLIKSTQPKVRQSILSLAQRLVDYINACDEYALKDLGELCYGKKDSDVKVLQKYIDEEY